MCILIDRNNTLSILKDSLPARPVSTLVLGEDIGNLPVPRGLKSGKVTIHLTWIIILIFTVTRLIHYPFGCTYPWVLFFSYYIPERFAEDLKELFFV